MKRTNRIIIILVIGVLMILSGISYAVLTVFLEGTVENVIKVGNLSLVLDEINTLDIAGSLPTSDEEGVKSEAFDFDVTNNGTVETGYTIYLDDVELEAGENKIPNSDIRYELKKNGVVYKMENLTDNATELYLGNIKPGQTDTFELRLWIDYNVTSLPANATHKNKLRIEGSQILHKEENVPPKIGTPVLSSDMIPVTYGENGEVYKASETSNWYDYDNKKWGNAITVTDETKASYMSASSGTEILMNDIKEMYVWIPRYSYDPASIENVENAIDVEIVTTDQSAHPAFCWGNTCQTNRNDPNNIELEGLWIGKFEMGTNYEIKPNLNSAHDSKVSFMYNKINDIIISEGDIHMIKNTEWGLVTYFSQSKYGVCNNDGTCTSKVANNAHYNSSTHDIITGCGPVMENDVVTDNLSTTPCPDTSRWNTNIGMQASTTNNIYGIYDMAGGRWDFVMGNMSNSSGSFTTLYSGFSAAPEAKYYDKYQYGTNTADHSRGLAGDATVELASTGTINAIWNDDHSFFVEIKTPFFLRGGTTPHLNNAGIFSYAAYDGGQNNNRSTRAAVTIIK